MRVAILNLNPGIDRVIYLDHPTRVGGMNRAARSLLTPGSKAANQARIFSLLCDEVDFCTFTGGPFGAVCDGLTAGEGITLHTVPTAAGVRTNTKIIDGDGACTEFNEAGGPVTAEELALLKTELLRCCGKAQVLSICGSLPQGVEKDFYRDVILAAREVNPDIIIALDCSGEALYHGFSAAPDIIKPNRGELAGLLSFHSLSCDLSTPEKICTACGKLGGKTTQILCTADVHGSAAVCPEGSWQVSTPTVPFRSFSGAGDTYLAAYLHKTVAEGKPIPEALAYASAAAAARVSRPGTELPTPADIEALLPKVAVTKINQN